MSISKKVWKFLGQPQCEIMEVDDIGIEKILSDFQGKIWNYGLQVRADMSRRKWAEIRVSNKNFVMFHGPWVAFDVPARPVDS